MKGEKLKIARITTVPMAFIHLRSVIQILLNRDHDVDLVTSANEKSDFLSEELQKRMIDQRIDREINIIQDLKSLFSLIFFLRKKNYHIVHSTTPKAGLIVALAGVFNRSIHVHTFTGQRWETLTGFKRKLLKFFDCLVIKLNHQCYADSNAQIDYLVKEGVASVGDVKCLGKGSNGGINLDEFNSLNKLELRKRIREKLEIKDSTTVFIFSGRVTKDKGVNELVSAFQRMKDKDVALIILGHIEEAGNIIDKETLDLINSISNIHHLGFVERPSDYLKASDVFVLPSYREGLSISVLEASACGLAVIGSDISCMHEAIAHNKTGLICKVKDANSLAQAMEDLESSTEKRIAFGREGEAFIQKYFDSKVVADLQVEDYQRLMNRLI